MVWRIERSVQWRVQLGLPLCVALWRTLSRGRGLMLNRLACQMALHLSGALVRISQTGLGGPICLAK